MLKIQSIEASLKQIDGSKLLDIHEIESCLRTADHSFRAALRSGSQETKN